MIVDAFHGAGGWAEGLRALGLGSVGVEYDPDMVATSRAAGHDCRLGDVAAVDPRELLGGEPCEGVIASPPCPSFSAMGKQLGRKDLPAIHKLLAELADGVDNRAATPMHDERSRLTAEPMRWVYLLRPEWVALEQVPAVLPVWQDMARILEVHGYHTWTGLVHSERYGVPQTRTRAVLLASRSRRVDEPIPTHRRYYPPNHKLAASPPDAHLPRWVSMADALGWGMTERPSMSVTSGGTYTGGAEVFGNGARKGIRRERDEGRWIAPAWTYERPATTHYGDRRGSQAIRVSVADAGRLQGFPADYPWTGTKGKQHMQAGNAVPPRLAEALLREVVGVTAGGAVGRAQPSRVRCLTNTIATTWQT